MIAKTTVKLTKTIITDAILQVTPNNDARLNKIF